MPPNVAFVLAQVPHHCGLCSHKPEGGGGGVNNKYTFIKTELQLMGGDIV